MPGYRIFKVGSPFNAEELFDADYVQSFDTMYLAHIDHKLTKLKRLSSHYDWQFSDVSFGPAIVAPASIAATATTPNTDSANAGNAYFPQASTYVVSAVDDISGQESRASVADTALNDLGLKRNYTTITWAAVTGATFYRVYKAMNDASFGYIGETTGLSFTDDNINADLSDAPVVGYDPFGTEGNYPSSLAFFEQRLFLGRTKNAPNAVFGTRSADFENMDKARPLKADDSLALAVSSGKVNSVNQLVPAKNLLALTSDSLFQLVGANDDYLSPNPPPKIERQNGRGASRLKAILVDDVTFFQPEIGSEVRTLGFSFDVDGFQSNDVSIFSPDFFEGRRIIDWAYAQEPLSVVWAVLSDGGLLSFTWQREQQVWGWTEHEMDGEVLSLCSVAENGEDRLYFIIKRSIGGEDRYYLEQMASAKWIELADACYLDCAVTYDLEEPSTTFTRLDHIEGREVWALADGFVQKGLTVTNGAVTLVEPASKVHIGLPVTAIVETMPLTFQTANGASAGTKQTSGRAHLRVVKTLGMTAGRSDGQQEDVTSPDGIPLGSHAEPYTGLLRVQMEQVVAFDTTVVVKQANPLPMRLTAAYVEANANR